MRKILIALGMAGLVAGAGQAAVIANGGFEGGPAAGDNQPVNVGQTTIPGWTVVDGTGNPAGSGKEIAWLGDGAYSYNTPFGTDYLDLTGYNGSSGDSGVAQTIATVIGGTYTLNFYLGAHPNEGAISVNVAAGGQSATIVDPVTSGTLATSTLWTLQSFDFTATSAQTTISIIGNNSGQDFIGLDNVSISGGTVSGAVPEPASWAMFIGGFGLVGGALRRRRVAVRFA